ncbi:MAG: hypothetical protein V7K14_09535 [Nostoc sp.]|uniref:hypothetical protein n=1 Tax=unclassified Nostoc TaxID=2593658 RepID=UPI0025D46127|nr:hypothetical protein [Nostoc sp. NMS7]MBN3946253.1 hypothetical protein [Nostoc sp. NMS7]
MDKLQKVKVVLPESEEWFRGIFNQTLGFIGLMEPIGIFMEGNQAALEFAEIGSSKVIRCHLWEGCWSDSSLNVETFLLLGERLGIFAQSL